MNHDQSPVRSALFVPASRPERIAKARASGADAVIVDLEDALPPRHKDSARRALAEARTQTIEAQLQRLRGDLVEHCGGGPLQIVEAEAALADRADQSAFEHIACLFEAVHQRAVETPAHLLHVGGKGLRIGPHRDDQLVDIVIHCHPFRSSARSGRGWAVYRKL